MKAPRDMTRREFKQALARHGFRQVLLWMQDDTGKTGVSYGMVMNTKGKVLRRASLAKAIRERGL